MRLAVELTTSATGATVGGELFDSATTAYQDASRIAKPKRWCSDLDDECPDVKCKLSCWLYEPARGLCPFLSTSRGVSDGK